MIGDSSIALLAFLAATLLHLVVLVLASYMPAVKLERPTPPRRTRYVVQFQQPAPTAPPTSVPIPPMPIPLLTPALPVPRPVKPLTRQPAPQPVRISPRQTQPTAVEVQRPEPLPRPVEMQMQPRQPVLPQQPVRVNPRREVANVASPKPIAPVPIERPKEVTARKPATVKVRQPQKPPPAKVKRPKRTATPKPSAPSPPAVPREPAAPRLPTPPQPAPPAKPALRPPQPAAPPVQDLQRQYLAMVSEALQRHKRYPRAARRRGLSGKVVLDFVILPNGQVVEAKVIASQSTRHTVLNKAALRALKRANPLPPFPKAFKKPSLRVTLPILYELTER